MTILFISSKLYIEMTSFIDVTLNSFLIISWLLRCHHLLM